MHVEILPIEGKIKYLGQMITLVDQGTSEVQHSIRCARSAFTKHRQELTSQPGRLKHRLGTRRCHTDNILRSRDVGYCKRT